MPKVFFTPNARMRALGGGYVWKQARERDPISPPRPPPLPRSRRTEVVDVSELGFIRIA